MAKTSSVNRNDKRQYMATRDKAKRAELKAQVMDRSAPVEDRFEATLEARAAAAQRRRRPRPASLRPDGPRPRQLSQVQAVAEHAAAAGQLGTAPRHGQGELVRSPVNVDDRRAG